MYSIGWCPHACIDRDINVDSTCISPVLLFHLVFHFYYFSLSFQPNSCKRQTFNCMSFAFCRLCFKDKSNTVIQNYLNIFFKLGFILLLLLVGVLVCVFCVLGIRILAT